MKGNGNIVFSACREPYSENTGIYISKNEPDLNTDQSAVPLAILSNFFRQPVTLNSIYFFRYFNQVQSVGSGF